MGKIRIKQIGEGLEEKKPRPKKKKEQKQNKEAHKPRLTSSDEVKGSALDKPETIESPSSPQRPEPAEGPTPSPISPPKKKTRSTRYKEAQKRLMPSNEDKGSTFAKALTLVLKSATANFDETIELHITLKSLKDSKAFRATAKLPHSTGKKQKVLILTSSPTKLTQPTKPNNLEVDLAGPEKVAEIKKSGSAPDVSEVWAAPDIMPQIAQIARILGPAGLMPNPKRGTVVKPEEIAAKIKKLSGGSTAIESERKAPIIHTTLGKKSMKAKELEANLVAILKVIDPGEIKNAFLSSTMSPSIKLNLDNL